MMRTPAALAGRICLAGLLVSCGSGRTLQVSSDRTDGGSFDTSRDTAAVVDANTARDLPLRTDGAQNGADATDAFETSDVSMEASPQVDGGNDGNPLDALPPSCVTVGGLSFSAPQVLPGVGGSRVYAMAAGANKTVAVVGGAASGSGDFYVDSGDGGRTFRRTIGLNNFGPDNVQIAFGPNEVYMTYALFTGYSSVILWQAAFDAILDPSSFEIIQFGPPGTYLGAPVTALDGRVAVLLANETVDGSIADEGEYISSAPNDGSFGEPHRLFWPPNCTGGTYHSIGGLFIVSSVDHIGAPPTMEIRRSNDNGATFSDPVSRDSSGGEIWCPKLYEMPDGQLLIVTREGDALSPSQRTVALRYDVNSNQFGGAVKVEEGHLLCFDTARTASGRQFITSSFGDASQAPTGVDLRYSDDGGLTWSSPYEIPGVGPNDTCPNLAASDDELYIVWRHGGALLLSRAGSSAACD